ncbi:MAG: hypothetical protein NDI63_13965 [Pseudobdellovibrio sp.]|nr:hypothetical protein [Pseudobdellovibrio sp.]
MANETQRQMIVAKINVITEIKKYTAQSEMISAVDMKLKHSLPQEFLQQGSPIIFQIVYSSEIKTYIFNVLGTPSPESSSTVIFTPQSRGIVQQFLTDLGPIKKKFVAA